MSDSGRLGPAVLERAIAARYNERVIRVQVHSGLARSDTESARDEDAQELMTAPGTDRLAPGGMSSAGNRVPPADWLSSAALWRLGPGRVAGGALGVDVAVLQG